METDFKQLSDVDFGKMVLRVVPDIYPYIKHRLFLAETSGVVPKNMYKAGGLLDDAILRLYEKRETVNNLKELKILLFTCVEKRLNKLYKQESFHKDTVSTSKILKKELQMMDEQYFLDAEEDIVMKDELDDISYHQEGGERPVFLYDDTEKNIVSMIAEKDHTIKLDTEKRLAIHRVYKWLPRKTSNILDLYLFGKMDFEEIALVQKVTIDEIREIMMSVRKSFRKNLE
ncbi:hypothetical protein [Robertkochia solimangrovi]|uniref:hypothetical protein n=1 Tax=Robertkochia solimangrovi TaxID=2213046 RepID=UPI001180C9E7|nr:hypothetical protein [Robertkochia solimangrovi]TRZ45287.1 hypothetical protein DMZ48_05950 [Robertkochia solimangrovi]